MENDQQGEEVMIHYFYCDFLISLVVHLNRKEAKANAPCELLYNPALMEHVFLLNEQNAALSYIPAAF